MSERKLIIDGEMWKYIVGLTGIGIRNPLDGRRYNVGLNHFFMTVTSGPTYISEDDRRPVTPEMVREYIEVVFLKTRSLPDFRMDYDQGSCHVYAHKSIPYEEVLRLVERESFWVTTPMKDGDPRIWGGENPNPARHAPTTHLMYFFEYKYEMTARAKARSKASFEEFKARMTPENYPKLTDNEKLVYERIYNTKPSQENT